MNEVQMARLNAAVSRLETLEKRVNQLEGYVAKEFGAVWDRFMEADGLQVVAGGEQDAQELEAVKP